MRAEFGNKFSEGAQAGLKVFWLRVLRLYRRCVGSGQNTIAPNLRAERLKLRIAPDAGRILLSFKDTDRA